MKYRGGGGGGGGGGGVLLLVIFVLGKLPYPHCFLWNQIQIPKLKLSHLVKMDVCILFAKNAQIDAAHFVMCFHSYALFQHERMA